MSKLMSKSTKKTMIITGFNREIYHVLPSITNKKEEDLLILNSFGAVISQPYGCLIRNIILALLSENVEEIYLVGEVERKETRLNQEEVLLRLKESGATEATINAINYTDVVEHDVVNWLVGPEAIRDVLRRNKELITGNPLIPKNIPVYAYIADSETGEYYPV
ncbi:hypothetical protein [Mesobacillus subterraneus]|uniref:Carbonic anhydrase n=1 Tax=Mesobacillus subterraneus TaxID=285983 RepID=A0A427TZ65_9BACI|nr:hypothetical protein [Mesobacillus subterraneus]RSD29540.1 hypothetical protein EJA10_00065 [Mesobacillus subterraneus]